MERGGGERGRGDGGEGGRRPRTAGAGLMSLYCRGKVDSIGGERERVRRFAAEYTSSP